MGGFQATGEEGEGQASPLDTLGDSPPRAVSCECLLQFYAAVAQQQERRSACRHKQMSRCKQPNVQRLPAETPEWKHGGWWWWGLGVYLSFCESHLTFPHARQFVQPDKHLLTRCFFFFFFFCRMGHLLSPKAFVWSWSTLRVNEGGGEIRYLTLFVVFVTTFTGRLLKASM